MDSCRLPNRRYRTRHPGSGECLHQNTAFLISHASRSVILDAAADQWVGQDELRGQRCNERTVYPSLYIYSDAVIQRSWDMKQYQRGFFSMGLVVRIVAGSWLLSNRIRCVVRYGAVRTSPLRECREWIGTTCSGILARDTIPNHECNDNCVPRIARSSAVRDVAAVKLVASPWVGIGVTVAGTLSIRKRTRDSGVGRRQA